jgi:hypothetical protein
MKYFIRNTAFGLFVAYLALLAVSHGIRYLQGVPVNGGGHYGGDETCRTESKQVRVNDWPDKDGTPHWHYYTDTKTTCTPRPWYLP